MGIGNVERVRAELSAARRHDQVHGAYLFEGAPGTAKRETALWFAKLLLCRTPGDDPCGRCKDCLQLHIRDEDGATRSQHPDLRILEPEGNVIKVDQVRALQRGLSLVAHEGGWRVAVILEADRLGTAASNALLKTLEEPPSSTSLLLVADVAETLPLTVRSRSTRLRFLPDPEALVIKGLREAGYSAEDARLAAALGGADVEAARGWAEENLEAAHEMRDAIQAAESQTSSAVLEFAEGFRGAGATGRRRAELLLDVHRTLAREAVAAAAEAEDRRGLESWLDRVEAGERARREMGRRNLNPQMVVEALLLSLQRGPNRS
jgi:DNA polymerase-3 subunit delta'